jgi:hypothetical protein
LTQCGTCPRTEFKGDLGDHPAAKVRIWRGRKLAEHMLSAHAIGRVELVSRAHLLITEHSALARPACSPTGPAAALKQISVTRKPRTPGRPPRYVRVPSAALGLAGREPARQRSGEPRHRQPRAGQISGRLAMVGVPTLPSQAPTAGLTNAGSRDDANRNRISAHGANGDTTGSRQTRSAPDWRRAAAACKRDGASSTHHLQHQPAYYRGRDCRAIAPSIRTICVRASRKLLRVEPTSYRYCRAQRCSWAPDYSIGLNNLMQRPSAPSPVRTSNWLPHPGSR